MTSFPTPPTPPASSNSGDSRSAQPIRTGNPDVDMAVRLYRPLSRQLGPEKLKHITDAVAAAVRAGAGKNVEDQVRDVTFALQQSIEDIVCAYDHATKTWRWWNPNTLQWNGPC